MYERKPMISRVPARNIILIGMPGAGKSTLGVLLAKAIAYDYIDTDVTIQAQEGRTLQQILDADGPSRFCQLEEHYLATLDCHHCVVATGGSAVYSERAMHHLKSLGLVIYLELSLAELLPRLDNLDSRGVVMAEGQSLGDLYLERAPLYQHYADLTIPCGGNHHDRIVQAMIIQLTAPGMRH